MMNVKEEYLHRYKRAEERATQMRRAIRRTSVMRLICAFCMIGTFVYLPGALLKVLGAIVTWGIFVWLIVRHEHQFKRKAWLEAEAQLNQQELQALDGKPGEWDNGQEFIDPTHMYSYDLDIFGSRSLFQAINRTCTIPGKRQLANWLSCQLKENEAILERQEAIHELSQQTDFCQQFRIMGMLHQGKAADETELRQWATSEYPLLQRTKFLPWMAGIGHLTFLLLTIAELPMGTLWGIWFCCWVILAFSFSHYISRMQVNCDKKLRILTTYAHQLHLLQTLHAQSTFIHQLQKKTQGAPCIITRLSRLLNALDQRSNYLIYILLNGLFFWECWQALRIEAWKKLHAQFLPHWVDTIGQMDALVSMATYTFNHPNHIFPIPVASDQEGFLLQAEALGHPLMAPKHCVCNDFRMERRPAFHIITGANMAGKSTYLRTVGINLILACCGLPVCARQMRFTPIQLVTDLHTSDSLGNNESYFFAELKRLKLIIDQLQAGKRLFIILDEILKGTNSVDKQKGTLALIRQFIHLNTNGIIATHDLEVSKLASIFPAHIENLRFEADIQGEELTFSYKLQPGVASHMNACFLMQKMGITVAD